MKKLFIALLTLSSVSAFANDILNRIPVGRYQGTNDAGKCWVFSSEHRWGTAIISISLVPGNVSPGPNQSKDFHESTESETSRQITRDLLTITNLKKPNDSYSRKQEVKLEIKNAGAMTMVKISSQERSFGMWMNKHTMNCSVKL